MVTLKYLADHPHFISDLQAPHLDEVEGSRIPNPESRLHRYRLPLAFLALEGERLVGWAGLTVQLTGEPGRRPELDALYVVPDRRGCGLGAALARRAIRKAAGLGHPQIVVRPSAGQEAFVERLGFRLDPERRQWIARTHARRPSVLCSV